QTVRYDGAVHRTAVAVLRRHAGGREERRARMVVPEQTRTDDAAYIGGQIRPAVAVDIGALLAVAAGQQRQPPARRDGRRVPEHAIGGAARRSVHDGLPLDLLPRTLRDEIDDAAHRPGPVKRRRDAFDDFDLREV